MDSGTLLQLPDAAILEVLRHLDARSLVMLEQTNTYFSRKEPASRLPLVEHVARESVHRACGSQEQAERFRHRSWRERLYLEQCTGVGFDRAFSEGGGFRFQFSSNGAALRSVRLMGMGPKLLVSDLSTREQGVLRWQLRVKGNTAVEFGIIPADLEPSHTALHKCMSTPGCPQHRATGFCSQITAGSLLPLKAPVMRGTVLDIVARRGHVEVVLAYPEDAREISWQNGQPVQRPYRGPSQLRFEQDFPADYDVRLAVTSWAKAHFEVLHTNASPLDPEWAASAAAEAAAEAAGAAVEAPAAQLMPAVVPHQLPEALLLPLGDQAAVQAADDAELLVLVGEEEAVEVAQEQVAAAPQLVLQAGQPQIQPQQHVAMLAPLLFFPQPQGQQAQQELAAPAPPLVPPTAAPTPPGGPAAATSAAALQQMLGVAQAAEVPPFAGLQQEMRHQQQVQHPLASGLQPHPVALAAAAVAGAPAVLQPAAALPQAQHAALVVQQQQVQQAGPDPEALAALDAAPWLAAGEAAADAALRRAGLAAAADTGAGADVVPPQQVLPSSPSSSSLCPSPSGELCQDGHLQPHSG